MLFVAKLRRQGRWGKCMKWHVRQNITVFFCGVVAFAAVFWTQKQM